MRLYREYEREQRAAELIEGAAVDDMLDGSLESILNSQCISGRRLLIIGMSANIDSSARNEAISRWVGGLFS